MKSPFIGKYGPRFTLGKWYFEIMKGYRVKLRVEYLPDKFFRGYGDEKTSPKCPKVDS